MLQKYTELCVEAGKSVRRSGEAIWSRFKLARTDSKKMMGFEAQVNKKFFINLVCIAALSYLL